MNCSYMIRWVRLEGCSINSSALARTYVVVLCTVKIANVEIRVNSLVSLCCKEQLIIWWLLLHRRLHPATRCVGKRAAISIHSFLRTTAWKPTEMNQKDWVKVRPSAELRFKRARGGVLLLCVGGAREIGMKEQGVQRDLTFYMLFLWRVKYGVEWTWKFVSIGFFNGSAGFFEWDIIVVNQSNIPAFHIIFKRVEVGRGIYCQKRNAGSFNILQCQSISLSKGDFRG